MIRIPLTVMHSEFTRVLLKTGFTQEHTALCAKLFTDSSRDGVYTHGINRFSRFINTVKKGNIVMNAEPVCVASFGALERWDGLMGPGNINAYKCMSRAIELAHENGIGCVALRNSNHWMRAGAYGLLAAENNCIGICWSNTIPIMPPWGGSTPKLGNNPIVFAVPRANGPVLLDMALSLYSYGKMESYARNNQELPYEAGWDKAGKPTRNPKDILEMKTPFPIGLWKGSGFSLVLDMISMMLSGGASTHEIGLIKKETRITQTFIAIDSSHISKGDTLEKSLQQIIDDMHSSSLQDGSSGIYYPGERMMITRKENCELGVPVEEKFWNEVLAM